jgi:hypothetical protein
MPERSHTSKKQAGFLKAGIYALIGVGLLILAGLAFVLLNHPSSAQFQDEAGEFTPAVPVEVNFPLLS